MLDSGFSLVLTNTIQCVAFNSVSCCVGLILHGMSWNKNTVRRETATESTWFFRPNSKTKKWATDYSNPTYGLPLLLCFTVMVGILMTTRRPHNGAYMRAPCLFVKRHVFVTESCEMIIMTPSSSR